MLSDPKYDPHSLDSIITNMRDSVENLNDNVKKIAENVCKCDSRQDKLDIKCSKIERDMASMAEALKSSTMLNEKRWWTILKIILYSSVGGAGAGTVTALVVSKAADASPIIHQLYDAIWL